jgi:hypothetical protein
LPAADREQVILVTEVGFSIVRSDYTGRPAYGRLLRMPKPSVLKEFEKTIGRRRKVFFHSSRPGPPAGG